MFCVCTLIENTLDKPRIIEPENKICNSGVFALFFSHETFKETVKISFCKTWWHQRQLCFAMSGFDFIILGSHICTIAVTHMSHLFSGFCCHQH